MAVQFTCSSCGAKYDVGDELAGKRILCRKCQQRGIVSGLGGAAAMASAADLPTRRGFNWVLLSVLGVGSIGTGVALARIPRLRPWRWWASKLPTDRGRWRGPPPGDPKNPKGGKGGAAGPAT